MDAFKYALVCEKAGARFMGFAGGHVKFVDPQLPREKRITHQWPAVDLTTSVVAAVLGEARVAILKDGNREAEDSGKYSGERVELDNNAG